MALSIEYTDGRIHTYRNRSFQLLIAMHFMLPLAFFKCSKEDIC